MPLNDLLQHVPPAARYYYEPLDDDQNAVSYWSEAAAALGSLDETLNDCLYSYLDAEGDLVLESFINIPGPDIPVHAEMVSDVLVRTLSTWKQYYAELARTAPLDEPPTPAPATAPAAPSI